METCSVFGCRNSSAATADDSLIYHKFPRGKLTREKWINACGVQSDLLDLTSAKVCELHFSEDAHPKNARNLYNKNVLKRNSVPTLCLPSTSEIIQTAERKVTNDGAKEVVEYSVPTETGTVILQEERSLPTEFATRLAKYKLDGLELAKIDWDNAELEREIESFKNSIADVSAQLEEKQRTLQMLDKTAVSLKRKFWQARKSYLTMMRQRKLLKKVFSDSQIKILFGKIKIYWSDDDMAVGYMIRHLSNKRCYSYLKDKLNIPLPALSSIRRWVTVKNNSTKQPQNDKEESE